jgi:cell division septum initiation protein DivIVA
MFSLSLLRLNDLSSTLSLLDYPTLREQNESLKLENAELTKKLQTTEKKYNTLRQKLKVFVHNSKQEKRLTHNHLLKQQIAREKKYSRKLATDGTVESNVEKIGKENKHI